MSAKSQAFACPTQLGAAAEPSVRSRVTEASCEVARAGAEDAQVFGWRVARLPGERRGGGHELCGQKRCEGRKGCREVRASSAGEGSTSTQARAFLAGTPASCWRQIGRGTPAQGGGPGARRYCS